MNNHNSVSPGVPHIVQGGIAVDDRGKIQFVNDFNFDQVKRFYAVSNHQAGTVRAWHAHKKEEKYVTVLQGAAVIGTVEIDDWEMPSTDCQIQRFVLSAEKPAILYIPAGYANGFMSLTNDTLLMFFSSSSLEDSLDDDWRYPARHWDIWQVEER